MKDLPKAYDPKETEEKWQRFWTDKRFFVANNQSKKPPYALVMPPPNVTGVLHMGHALVNTLQDILARYKRMCGFEVLWVPGTDHAGIATQTVVERHLMKTEGKRRVDYDRKTFLGHVFDWKKKSETRILEQINRLGCSLDFTRYRFTMDKEASKAVRTLFKKLFDQGLIYRGDYLVNWDPVTQTALADDEVEYEEREDHIYTIKYTFADGDGAIEIATTRPETLFGDTAVAVHPSDGRYAHLIGKELKLPLTDRTIPLVGDHFVKPEFGTGAVKVTPAHDPNDHAIGFRHNLPLINILTPTAHLNEVCGSFEGLSVQEARSAVVEKLKSEGLLVKAEPHAHRVGVSYRSKAVIEPYLSKQWFVKMAPFKEMLKEVVAKGEVKLIPNWDGTYNHWIDNLRDWCISRQLWWGHRIPIWYNKDNPDELICSDCDDIPDEVKANPDKWEQDPDVLDTWFSSSLWPFSTLGWPDKSPDLDMFYPNATLITGHDILFFWVARMILMGKIVMDEVPFKETFIHGLIYGKSYWRDNPDGGITYVSNEERIAYDLGKACPKDVHSKWEKMSKSKGNVIDPIEIIDIYGTDAMRMALTSTVTHARQIDLDRRRFEEFKNFANKVWNGARFALMNLENLSITEPINDTLLTLDDRWILSKMGETVKAMHQHLQKYEFDKAAHLAYAFYWDELCAYYLEIVKPVLFGKEGNEALKVNKQKLLLALLTNALLILHPLAPFITEEIFQEIKKIPIDIANPDPLLKGVQEALSCESICIAPYPEGIDRIDPEAVSHFETIRNIVVKLRNMRSEMNLPPQTQLEIYIGGNQCHAIEEGAAIVRALIRTESLTISQTLPKLPFAISASLDGLEILISLPKEHREKEVKRLRKDEEKLAAQIASLSQKLSNESFTSRAPAQLVAQTRETLQSAKEKLQSTLSRIKTLGPDC